MQIVIHDNRVVATHADSQGLAGLYPGCLILSVPDGTPVEIGQPWNVDLDAARAAKIREAAAACDAVLQPLGTEYGAWERETWDVQANEADALMAAPEASTPMLDAMSSARGMDRADLAQRILRNREAWSAISGAVVGQRLAIVDKINAATTVDDVLAVDVNISLPG